MKKLGIFLLLATALVGCQSPDPVQKASPELQREYNAAFQKMLNDPGNLDVVMAYAQVATKTGDYEGAVGAYESLLLVDSNLPRVKLELGILYYRLKSYDTSRIYLEGALASPSLPADVRKPAELLLAKMPKQSKSQARLTRKADKGIVMSKSNVVVRSSCAPSLSARPCWVCSAPRMPKARIGVTQSIQNNPMGKPPGGLDRVLRVGTDVQANEIISTTDNDRAHLVFLDGTTLTIGPSSSMTIDKFVYDPTTQKGELAVNATKGVFRLIGGRISKTSTIAVTTPAATMGIRGGIAVFGVQASATTSILVFGNSLTVTAGGVTQTITVPGLSVTTPTGGTPGAPTIAVQGSLAAALAALAGNSTASAATVARDPDARREQPRQPGDAAGSHTGDRHCEYGDAHYHDHHHQYIDRNGDPRKSESDRSQPQLTRQSKTLP